jgi:hypothetical protein
MRGGGKWVDHLEHITRVVKELGHEPLTEVADDQGIAVEVEGSGDQWIFNRDMAWLGMAECLIAEVSAPSLGVGYEVAVALHEARVPVLALCHESVRALSAMIHGNTSPLLELRRYNELDDIRDIVRAFLSKIADSQS